MHSRMIEYMKTIVHFETRHELENDGVSNVKYMSTALPLSWHSSTNELSTVTKILLQAKKISINYLSTHSLSLLYVILIHVIIFPAAFSIPGNLFTSLIFVLFTY